MPWQWQWRSAPQQEGDGLLAALTSRVLNNADSSSISSTNSGVNHVGIPLPTKHVNLYEENTKLASQTGRYVGRGSWNGESERPSDDKGMA